jgi:SAM-dependent methyltransferase
MDADAYTLMAAHEGRHWWFVGRRAVIAGLLDRIALPANSRILEAGCGTGGNLSYFQLLGNVAAFEPHAPAVEIARDRYPMATVEDGALPDRLPFPDDSFDLVAALDVLEHVDDDVAALDALVRLAKPGAYIIVTVPTHPFLWGRHDRRLHHVRRYDVRALRDLCRHREAELEYFGPFNTLLAPIAVTARIAEKFLPLDFGNQERLPPPPINAALAAIFALEGRLVRHICLPFGLSHAVILRRRP